MSAYQCMHNHWVRRFTWVLSAMALLWLPGCGDQAEQEREFAIRRSIRNYWSALDMRTEEALRTYVYFPGVMGYREHVNTLITRYLENAQDKQKVRFDEQGVVLSRFLRLQHLNYELLELQVAEDGMNAEVRIAFRFAYDSLLEQSDYEEGTKVLIPVEPLGSVAVLVAGESNNTPRYQLAYLELDVGLRKTNFEDYWQVRRMVPVDGSAKYDVSIKSRF